MDTSTAHQQDSAPLLETKLFPPRWRSGLVARRRLVDRLIRDTAAKLILISAPAGFGKSTLLAEWLDATQGDPAPVAWLSIDRSDNDPVTFWSYVIGAIQRQIPNIGRASLELFRSPQPPPTESILTVLINELALEKGQFTLVLDDFHLIEEPAISHAVAYLLDHLPTGMRLIIAGRSDPPFPLSRLRGRGEMIEFRAADLRFTASEAMAFFRTQSGLDLSSSEAAILESRTEGWIAGLQLAALSMQGRDDTASFIEAFAGDTRFVLDYLAEEVLSHQSPEVRDFLLQTSILERLHGSLCDAVTGRSDGTSTLDALERGNVFTIPLDEARRWFRYHHLFADVLQARLQDDRRFSIEEMHLRASTWFEEHALIPEAVGHAIAGRDFTRAGRLINSVSVALRRNRQERTLLGWLSALPATAYVDNPELRVEYAFSLLPCGEDDRAEEQIDEAVRELARTGTLLEVGGETDTFGSGDGQPLQRAIIVARAGIAMARNDLERSEEFAREALRLAPPTDHLWRGASLAMLGLVAWSRGDLDEAHDLFRTGQVHLRQAGNISDVVGGSVVPADIRLAQGRLRDAERVYRDALQLAASAGDPVMRGTADMHVGLSELCLERGDLDGAAQVLQQCREQGEHTGFPTFPYRWRVAMARLLSANGDLPGAIEHLDEAERLYVSDFHPNVRPVAAIRARVWLDHGRSDMAFEWARGRGLSSNDELAYLLEYEHITLARTILSGSTPTAGAVVDETTHDFLERLLEAAETGGRMRSVIELLLLKAVEDHKTGRDRHGEEKIRRALSLAEPEDYGRVFTGEGEVMRDLLLRVAGDDVVGRYASRLLSTMSITESNLPEDIAVRSNPATLLTGREVEIVRLIATGLRNDEIADQLFISVPTVKRHIANAYRKLDVSNRVEAVSRARVLGLL